MEHPKTNPATNKILVVEDDICLSHIITRIFKSIEPQPEIHWVCSAEEADIKIKENDANYSLIIADYTLNGDQTGIDLWNNCLKKYPKIPFMMISSLTISMFFDLIGPNKISPPFLPKPFYTGEFRQMIEALLH